MLILLLHFNQMWAALLLSRPFTSFLAHLLSFFCLTPYIFFNLDKCNFLIGSFQFLPSHAAYSIHRFLNKGPLSQRYGFSSSHVWMWELDYKEGWVPKNWSFRTVVLEKTLESPLDSKESKPVNPKGYQPWVFMGRIDAEAEAPKLGQPDVKSWLTGKDPDAGKDWRQKEHGVAEDEMAR